MLQKAKLLDVLELMGQNFEFCGVYVATKYSECGELRSIVIARGTDVFWLTRKLASLRLEDLMYILRKRFGKVWYQKATMGL